MILSSEQDCFPESTECILRDVQNGNAFESANGTKDQSTTAVDSMSAFQVQPIRPTTRTELQVATLCFTQHTFSHFLMYSPDPTAFLMAAIPKPLNASTSKAGSTVFASTGSAAEARPACKGRKPPSFFKTLCLTAFGLIYKTTTALQTCVMHWIWW